MPTLFVIATPLGNLEDISRRALSTLKDCSLVFAEDTRNTLKLFRHFGIETRLESLHEHNEFERKDELENLFANHDAIGLVSDAGTPVLSDPGQHLVAEAHRLGLTVSPLPGPSALASVLSVAGFTVQPSTFWGFLAKKKKERETLYSEWQLLPGCHVFFTSPRLAASVVKELAEAFPKRELCMCRELTKIHEEVLRFSLSEIPETIESRGEFTFVLSPDTSAHGPVDNFLLHLSTKDHLLVLMNEQSMSTKDAVASVAKSRRLPHREVYSIALTLSGP